MIYNKLKNPYTKLYLYFMTCILGLICERNIELQAEKLKMLLLYRKIEMFRTIVGMYTK